MWGRGAPFLGATRGESGAGGQKSDGSVGGAADVAVTSKAPKTHSEKNLPGGASKSMLAAGKRTCLGYRMKVTTRRVRGDGHGGSESGRVAYGILGETERGQWRVRRGSVCARGVCNAKEGGEAVRADPPWATVHRVCTDRSRA